MAVAFTRQLGSQPGIQLNPLRDQTDGFQPDNSDQVFAIAARLTRGQLGRPFKVNRSNYRAKLGMPESVRKNELNEAAAHLYEALNKGAYEAVIYRLHTEEAALKYIGLASFDALVSVDPVTNTDAEKTVDGFAVFDDLPSTPFAIMVKHNECFNDGVRLALHADALPGNANNMEVTLRVLDKAGEVLYEFQGNLDPDSVDDYEVSDYLPNVVSKQLGDGELEVWVGDVTGIPSTSPAYGRDVNGRNKWAVSETLLYFTEGSTAYTLADYAKAREALHRTKHDYAYITSGGSKSPALLAQMAQLAYDTNRQFRFDVPGNLKPEEAISFVEQLNIGSHLVHAFWSPLMSDDPAGVNGNWLMGTCTLNIALACGRNAQIDARGFAPKNYPIAGKEWTINRTGMRQLHSPSEQELSALADAKINPVLLERYNGGSSYVFTDSLTTARTRKSYKKLIAVADMSTTLDEWITRFGKECLQLPMDDAIRRMSDYLQTLFEGAQAAKWLIPSEYMEGDAFRFEVKRHETRPADSMVVNYYLHYDGTLRQGFFTQTISK